MSVTTNQQPGITQIMVQYWKLFLILSRTYDLSNLEFGHTYLKILYTDQQMTNYSHTWGTTKVWPWIKWDFKGRCSCTWFYSIPKKLFKQNYRVIWFVYKISQSNHDLLRKSSCPKTKYFWSSVKMSDLSVHVKLVTTIQNSVRHVQW